MIQALGALAMGVAFDILFYRKAAGVSWFLYIALAFLSVSWMGRQRHKSDLDKTQYVLLGASLTFAAFLALRTAPEIMFCDALLSVVLFIFFLARWLGAKAIAQWELLEYFFWPCRVLWESLFKGLGNQRETFASVRDNSLRGAVMNGIFLSIIPLVILTWLMMGADMIFRAWAGHILGYFKHWPELGWRGLLVIVVASVFTGLYAFTRTQSLGDKTPAATEDVPKKDLSVEVLIAGTLMNTLLAVFAAIQFVFLFGGQKVIESLGVTYSLYARQGFWQMVAIALIILTFSLFFENAMVCAAGKKRMMHKVSICFLCILSGVIMISAFYRLLIYERMYGFTVLRFYSHTFVVFLGALFALLVFKAVAEEPRTKFVWRAFWLTIALFLAWNISNPHSFISRMNLARYETQGSLDTSYLLRLSADAVPDTLRILSQKRSDPTIATAFEKYRNAWKQKIKNELQKHAAWQSHHWGIDRAANALSASEGG